MAEPTLNAPGQPPEPPHVPDPIAQIPPVVVKKYANRRLYNTETSSYITLDNLAGMIRAGRDFIVYDAKSGDDITRGVLTQIIVEEESKGSAMLPTAFLRQLIGFYGGNMQGVVPRYLEYTMSSFARQQQQVRTLMEQTFSPFLPTRVEDMNRQSLAMFERAFSLWNPFHRDEHGMPMPAPDAATFSTSATDQPNSTEPQPSEPQTAPSQPQLGQSPAEVDRLRSEIESLQRQLAAAHAAALTPRIEPAAPGSIPDNVRRDPIGNGADMNKAVRKSVRGNTPA